MEEVPALTEICRLMASGALSPAELLDCCIGSLEATEERIRAWVTLDVDRAHDQARQLGSRPPDDAPLWGIPVGIKDIVDVAGLPTTAASRILAGNVAPADAPAVRCLRAAGAVVIGKTNTQEFAYGCVSPPTTNPWDAGRIPGGSSGGSAAAVVAGHCLGALGSDTAGSIRIPSALCGACGLKPRPGIVPADGVIPLAPTFDAVGPIARTVGDLGLLWGALTGRLVRLGGLLPRVVVAPESVLPELDPGVATAFYEAVRILDALAPSVRPATIPPFGAFDGPRSTVLMWEAMQVHRARGWWPARAAEYTDETREYLAYTDRTGSREATEAARRECERLGGLLASAIGEDEVLATPTVPCEAPTHAQAASKEEGSPRRPVVRDLTRIPGPVNVAGLAGLSVPCGFTPGGLPAGLHLVGKDEETLLRLGLAYERETKAGL
ncbi:MAG TPA: amidase [Actinomycetota bacterium]|jgi:aspartyl-tRNA(Asn)/glutamyl-tRNA(Gln) amidotransferase subunit A